MDMARLHPERNFIGIEMYDSVLLRALQKREELEEQGESFFQSGVYPGGCEITARDF